MQSTDGGGELMDGPEFKRLLIDAECVLMARLHYIEDLVTHRNFYYRNFGRTQNTVILFSCIQ